MSDSPANPRPAITRRAFLGFAVGLPVTLASLICAPSEAYALDLTRSNYLVGMGSKTVAKAKALAKKVGAKKVTHKTYTTYCAKGNKMVIGVCKNPSYPNAYVLIRNTGNKNVSFMGAKIGMTKAAAKKKLEAKGWRTSNGGKTYFMGNAEKLKLTYRDGKVSAFEYRLAPTGY